MKIKIAKVAQHNGQPVAFTVKIKGLKYPRGFRDWYFPEDKLPETAIKMALQDYEELNTSITT